MTARRTLVAAVVVVWWALQDDAPTSSGAPVATLNVGAQNVRIVVKK